jgi:hypothetical protein
VAAAKKPATVAEYLAQLEPERKQAISAVRKLIKRQLPKGYEETMQYGMPSYVVPLEAYPAGYLGKKDVPLPYLALAAQKRYMSVYLMGVYADDGLARWFETAWRKTGKRLDCGKSCLRFTSVDDLALDVLGQAVASLPVGKYVELYDRTRGGAKKPNR